MKFIMDALAFMLLTIAMMLVVGVSIALMLQVVLGGVL